MGALQVYIPKMAPFVYTSPDFPILTKNDYTILLISRILTIVLS